MTVSPEQIAARAGVTDLSPEELARLRLQAESIAAAVARIPRFRDERVEPAPVLAVPVRP